MEDEKLSHIRHSLAHLLAMAVREKYDGVRLANGPAIENGFYYDFEFPEDTVVREGDLKDLEKRMRELVREGIKFEGKEITEGDGMTLFTDEPYKLETLHELAENNEKITTFTSGNFTDLCRGGHVENTSEIDPDGFSLDRIAGAYWKGDEKNKMLTRIYGLAFASKKGLEEYTAHKEEAKKWNHRKLGKELDLFTFSDLVGAGLPLFTPKGTVLRTELQNVLFNISRKYDMEPVTIPHIAKRELYETSGHADKFGDELIKVTSHYDEFVMKPVNCPHHIQIFNSRPRSYRELPVRYMESTMQYRDEKPGEIGGLTRVRAITVDDGHIFCTADHIKEEAKRIAKIIEEFYTGLGLYGSHWVSLSVRDSKNLENYIGEEKDWKKAEEMLQSVSDELNLNAKRVEGEAAIYGPKLDYIFKDSLDREWQLATIQIDFAMPKRFKLSFTNKDGESETPVMIHRAILGSYERFLAILIEHFKGAFPFWLSPVQVKILPISEKHKEYAEKIFEETKNAGFRTELDDSDETLGKKIRNAQLEKVPYYLVLGDKEKDANSVMVEGREGKVGEKTLDEFIDFLKTVRDNKQN